MYVYVHVQWPQLRSRCVGIHVYYVCVMYVCDTCDTSKRSGMHTCKCAYLCASTSVCPYVPTHIRTYIQTCIHTFHTYTRQEGLDVPACNAVIRMDGVTSDVALVQSKVTYNALSITY